MIETKEQWEEIKSDVQSDISTQHEKRLVKLIEALREVARAAEFRGHHVVAESPCGGEGKCNICDALVALPDWITE